MFHFLLPLYCVTAHVVPNHVNMYENGELSRLFTQAIFPSSWHVIKLIGRWSCLWRGGSTRKRFALSRDVPDFSTTNTVATDGKCVKKRKGNPKWTGTSWSTKRAEWIMRNNVLLLNGADWFGQRVNMHRKCTNLPRGWKTQVEGKGQNLKRAMEAKGGQESRKTQEFEMLLVFFLS